jgi:spore coat polysaccharide biosynthesis predicted glycosyltransferase SpsG
MHLMNHTQFALNATGMLSFESVLVNIEFLMS